jgi:hypothetical protein
MYTPTIITTELRTAAVDSETALDPIRVAAAVDAAGYDTAWQA